MSRRITYLSVIFLLLAAGAFSQEFDRIVDFQKTLKDISLEAALSPPGRVAEGKFIILEGSVASRWVVDPSPESYLGEIELVDGEWDGVESVKTYSCIVQFSGSKFVSAIPAGRSKAAASGEIAINSRVLIAGKVIGVKEVETTRIPVVSAVQFRTIR